MPHPLFPDRRKCNHVCRFCGSIFLARIHPSPLLDRFCPRCLDLWAIAIKVVTAFEGDGGVERVGPHSVVFPCNLRRHAREGEVA